MFRSVIGNTFRSVNTFRKIKCASITPCLSKALCTSTATEPFPAGGIGQRFLVTFEVTVSKLFPAGFGWHTVASSPVTWDSKPQTPASLL